MLAVSKYYESNTRKEKTKENMCWSSKIGKQSNDLEKRIERGNYLFLQSNAAAHNEELDKDLIKLRQSVKR